LKQDWREFVLPGATVIAQSVFWPGGGISDGRWQMFINSETVGRLRHKLRITKPAHLNRFFQTQLISNAEGPFKYYGNPRKRLTFGKAEFDDDTNFAKTLYTIYLKHVLPLGPHKVIDGEGKRYGVIVLGMIWLEKMIQIIFRLRDLAIESPEITNELIDELHKVTRLREESVAILQGTCIPEYSRLVSWANRTSRKAGGKRNYSDQDFRQQPRQEASGLSEPLRSEEETTPRPPDSGHSL
jgi:hypothetical protein